MEGSRGRVSEREKSGKASEKSGREERVRRAAGRDWQCVEEVHCFGL